jgi:hypothetical protein
MSTETSLSEVQEDADASVLFAQYSTAAASST